MQASKRDVRWPAALVARPDDPSSVTGRTLLAAFLAACASVAIPAVSPAPTPPGGLPQPPYPRFAGVTFEPSAAAFDPATGRVLVLSDHDTTLYRYELSAAGLVLPPGERHDPLQLPEGLQVAKFEGMTRLPSGGFLAVTAFDRPDPRFRRLLRFSYTPAAPAKAVAVAVNDEALGAAIRGTSGLPWFKIEALAVDRTGTHVLFGVRNVGESYQSPRDVVLVVRCPLADDRVGPPEAVIRLSTAEALWAGGMAVRSPARCGRRRLPGPHQPRGERDQPGWPLGPPLPGSRGCASGRFDTCAGPPRRSLEGVAGQARGAGGRALRRPGRGLRRRPRLEAPLRRLRADGRPLHGDRPAALTGASRRVPDGESVAGVSSVAGQGRL